MESAKIKKTFKLSPEHFNLGFYLMTPLLLGVFIGLQLDKYFNSKPALTVAGIILGTIGTFYNLKKILEQS